MAGYEFTPDNFGESLPTITVFDATGSEVTVSGWRALAACLDADPDIFFPEQGGDVRAQEA